MEDEDGESKVVDMWNILGEQQLKDSTLGNTLKHPIDNVYTDVIEEEKQIIRYNSVAGKDSPGKNSNTGSKIVFKGFKKRILAQAQETQTNTSKNSTQEQQVTHSNASPKNSKDKRVENKRGKITEYAQYLGLQPSSKYKCSKCHSSTNPCPTLKQNPCTCNSSMAPMPSTSESSSVSHATNFKITRKVYLCAACDTYFENWNLFLHMRDIHKRHICLFCLGMFGQAERLSYHLSKKHSVPEMAFTSVEDFYNAFKGSCYLVCCTCEKVFSETDNFYNHFCSPPTKQDANTSTCTLCRQTGTHASTCTLAIETSKASTVPFTTATQANAVSATVHERPTNAGSKGVSRKVMKNSRTKHGEDGVPNSYQQKSNASAKKTSMKAITSQFNENQSYIDVSPRDDSVQSDVTNSLIRDTVSETIMEVSRYVGDSCDENDDRDDKDFTADERSQGTKYNESYDSVTQTIMEVSRCTNDEENERHFSNRDHLHPAKATDKTSLENDMHKTDDVSPLNSTREDDDNLDESSPMQRDLSDDTILDNKRTETTEDENDSASQEQNLHSPVSRSLFSPQHESHIPDIQPKEERLCEESNEEENPAPNESQTSVSFNAVPSSDRSLVIKICTNRNSQFSVTTSTEDHNVSKESEENNNADGSTSEKVSNVSEKEGDSIGSYHVNDGDTDSDSDKLAVVDSNPEDVEEADETGETENQAETSTEIKTEINGDEDQKPLEKDENGVLDDNEESIGATKEEAKDDDLEQPAQPSDEIALAGEDVPSVDLNVEGTLDSMEIEDLLKRCIDVASPFCVYCNHARHIAVNGKQLGLHMLAEHKFQPQHPAIIIHAEQFITRVKKSLDELESRYFNLNSYSSTNGTYNVPDVRTYECFHCRFHSAVHKELYLHNRKMHQKTILICIMCKSTFYSYSELLCHLCPGAYSPNINVRYRCCLCPVTSLPSAFRLMVHLRKRHHACDVCLESTGNQQRLSNHVWKHKLHHLCYRCGIAYRNKPDITKHLFWKHGTESVLCKKCLQKKWPHIYHFCIPPTAFVCEECGSSFSRAVALKVHKRLHSGDMPHGCNECPERFISRKLLLKHENSHKEPPVVETNCVDAVNNHQPSATDDEKADKDKITIADGGTVTSESAKDVKETVKKVVDVYDLPPLNLSSESDTDSEEEKTETKDTENSENKQPTEASTVTEIDAEKPISPVPVNDSVAEEERNEEEKKQEAQIMDGIWDNFKTYTASLEMKDSNSLGIKETEPEIDVAYLRSIVLADHDYCVVWTEDGPKENREPANENECKPQRSPSAGSVTQNTEGDGNKKKVKTPKKKKQSGSTSSSDSSSDSDSSSCSCGTNCSCSSSSSGSSSSSSSSSDSDSSASESSPKKQSGRKDRKKDKESTQENKSGSVEPEGKDSLVQVENGAAADAPSEPVSPPKPLLRESDLETEETETDEDFYDEHPQQLANKLLAEKRNQLLLLAAVAPASAESTMPLNNGIAEADLAVPSPEPMATVTEEEPQPQQKRKVKTKKRKRGERGRRNATPTVESIKLNIPKAFYQKNQSFSVSSPATMALQHNRSSTPNLAAADIHGRVGMESHPATAGVLNQTAIGGSGSETENKRSSKRKRVPKRFYGDSSDEETEKQPTVKWRKADTASFVSQGLKTVPPRLSFGGKTVATYRPVVDSHTENLAVTAAAAATAASATESEEPAESSSESSESETEVGQQQQQQQTTHLAASNAPITERSVNLYCYCQCPYDEVSEMIACDGEDCRIEWFHFECVGIMVPPKGKWYCPDCRKKHGIMQNSDDYFD